MLSESVMRQREPAECVIRVSGREITDLYPLLVEVRAESRRNEASTATLQLEAQRDELGRWSVLDAGVFQSWAPVIIEAAFGARREVVLRGYIRQTTARYTREGGATVTIECQDESLALDREHIRKVWGLDAPMSDLDILRDIVNRHRGAGGRLDVSPDSAAGVTGLIAHQDGTDIQFLRKRASVNGYELMVQDGLVYFGPMRLDGDPQPTLLFQAGADSNCLALDVIDDGHLPDEIGYDIAAANGTSVERRVVSSTLPLLGREAADSRGSGLAGFRWLLSGEGAGHAGTLAARARARADEFSMKIRADGELDGTLYGHVLQAGRTVVVDGIGERYGGTYYVNTVTHVFSGDGYRQSFRLLRNAYGSDSRGLPADKLAALD